MSPLHLEINNPRLTQLGVEAITDFYQTMATAQLNLPGLAAFVTGVDSPFLNVVIDTRVNQTTEPQQIETIAAFFAGHQVPWVWFVEPVAHVTDLEQHGLRFLEEAPGMYFDLSQPLPTQQAEFRIVEVAANDDLHQWIEPLNEGFPSPDNGESYRQLNANLLNTGETKLKHFIAYSDNDVAAAATLFLGKDAVMLHNLATKLAYQKRGLGKALALHRMQVARDLGYRHCFLDASEEGYQLHKRIGMQVYCLTRSYTLTDCK